jgi:hypothetical protein
MRQTARPVPIAAKAIGTGPQRTPSGVVMFRIAGVPDNSAAAALSLNVNATGTATTKITVLLTTKKIDAAARKTFNYRPPGR